MDVINGFVYAVNGLKSVVWLLVISVLYHPASSVGFGGPPYFLLKISIKLSFFLASPASESYPEPKSVKLVVCWQFRTRYVCVMCITTFDNFNVSGYQLTSELFSNNTPSGSCMFVGSNIRVNGKSDVDGKSDVGSSELVVN